MISFIKKLFSKNKQNTTIIQNKKWSIDCLKVYIAPLKIPYYAENENKYKNMVIQAFDTWTDACDKKLRFKITDRLYDSHINIEWRRIDKQALGSCYFQYDNKGNLFSAEVNIGLFPNMINESIDYDTEIYHSILHCIGIALGVPQTNNPEDIMCIPHQVGKIKLSENDKKAICKLYNLTKEPTKTQGQLNMEESKEEMSEEIENIRKQEDEKIVEHLKAIYDIVKTKCSRCNNVYGCMGCTLSPGDGLRGYIDKSLEMMSKQSEAANRKISELFPD